MIEKVLAKLQSEIGNLVGQIAFLTVQNQALAEEVRALKTPPGPPSLANEP